MILQTLPYQLVRPNSIYFFSQSRRSDKLLTSQYEKAVKQHRGEDSGIQIASALPPDLKNAH